MTFKIPANLFVVVKLIFIFIILFNTVTFENVIIVICKIGKLRYREAKLYLIKSWSGGAWTGPKGRL